MTIGVEYGLWSWLKNRDYGAGLQNVFQTSLLPGFLFLAVFFGGFHRPHFTGNRRKILFVQFQP